MPKKRIEKNKIENILQSIVKSGLTKYKTKHSKSSLFEMKLAEKEDKLHRKGAIFAVRNKSDFTDYGVKGYIITSKETLFEDVNGLTHWTPNVFRKFGYTDHSKQYIHGHEEKNLLQVNTFVVDIDTKKYSVQDILMACMDDSIGVPTIIVESDRGYQVYFVLSDPIFISNKNDFRSLKVAKRISDNIKRSLSTVEADVFCNDFGFFRIPTNQNIVHLSLEHTYNTSQLISWSQRQNDDDGRGLFATHFNKSSVHSAIDSNWFNALINTKGIKGSKGRLGRNNTMFTLALVCMSEGWDKSRTFDLLDQFNSNLYAPLKINEITTLLDSAYSGEYNGAKKEYVEILLSEYVANSQDYVIKLGGSLGWYKHKKARNERERSHIVEWEDDLIKWITAEKSDSEPFIWHTQKEICEVTGIPQSTLNKLLKESKKIIKTVSGKGRSAKTGWTTVALFIKYAKDIALLLANKKETYRIKLHELVGEQLNLVEKVAGYNSLVSYLLKLEFIESIYDKAKLDLSG